NKNIVGHGVAEMKFLLKHASSSLRVIIKHCWTRRCRDEVFIETRFAKLACYNKTLLDMALPG
ncbi:MAG: hypothetical protein UIL73_01685, partial [Anaerovoracaceae bacterium]|nr:hypothetical protein [Anaerovoracaceae bacterium]